MVVRLLLWDLYESKTTIDELREALPALELPSAWIWNEASDRFGAILHGEELPESAGWATDLIGGEPEVYEEFDLLEP
jgi:hypothetical protein